MDKIIYQLIKALGQDPERAELKKTPQRVEKALKFCTSGYNMDIDKTINGSIFDENIKDMVIVKDIEFYSMCEHHLLPFYGKCHIGYIPNGKIIGLSKLPRIVEVFARRLQLQERLSTQIAHTIFDKLKPSGVGVVMEGSHLCMMMRGVQKQNSKAVTSCMLGSFKSDQKTRTEFLKLIKQS